MQPVRDGPARRHATLGAPPASPTGRRPGWRLALDPPAPTLEPRCATMIPARLPLSLAAAFLACTQPPAPAEAPELAGRVELGIGTLEGPEETTFGRVTGLAVDGEGRIYVADGQAHEIRVFDAAGGFLHRFGRRGGGPGELEAPCCLALGPDGLLWVRDGGNARYATFALGSDSAQASGTVRFQHGDANFHAPLTFDEAGRLVDVGHRAGEGGAIRQVRFHVDGQGQTAREVELPDDLDGGNPHTVAGAGGARFFLYQPFGPVQLAAHGPGGTWAVANSGRYEVRWAAPDGTERTVGRPEQLGPPLTDAERARGEERIADMLGRFQLSRGALPFDVPERHPPLRSLFFDQEGRLWVELSTPAGEARRAEVHDPSGGLAATVAWPRDVTFRPPLGWVEDGMAVGVRTDSLGVQEVVRLSFEGVEPATPR